MKKHILFLIPLLFINTVYSQVLYSEDFDNYTLGALGTDTTLTLPGQGGWFTLSTATQSNTMFAIVNETGRGKVLDITSPLSDTEGLNALKRNLKPLVSNRTPGNDVIKFEIDYNTGSKQPSTSSNTAWIHILSDENLSGSVQDSSFDNLAVFAFDKIDKSITGDNEGGSAHNIISDDISDDYYLPFNTWVKIIIYLDYPNRKVYFDIPYLNKAFVGDFLKKSTSTNLIQDFAPDAILLRVGLQTGQDDPLTYTRNRYDNIKLTALNTVPPEVVNLSINEQLNHKFNLYPNPANNVVNITNNENMVIEQVSVYDTTGKLINTQSFNNQAELQLNVENLASGTYLLHLQTNEGVAVKKLVKK